MFLTQVLKLFAPKNSEKTSQIESVPAAEAVNHDELAADLMNLYRNFRARVRVQNEKSRTWKTSGNYKLETNDNGLYVMRDDEGRVVKTRDALRRVREYRYDENGMLEVNKFGIWSRFENARLSETGTLVWRNAERETYECLDGTVICISFNNKSLIAQNENTGEEITISLKGTMSHLYKKDGLTRYRLYSNDLLVSESESFEDAISYPATTMSEGKIILPAVTRIDRTYINGKIASETFRFDASKETSKVCLNLPSGELHLSKVRKVENRFEDGNLSETIFELSEPVSVSRDKEGNVSLIRGINKVRRFQLHDGVASVVFIDSDGNENLHFPTI